MSRCDAVATTYGSINAPLVVENVHDKVDGTFKAAIFGFSDGLTTSLNLVLGVALVHRAHATVVLTGMAGLFAGASSMGCGEWLSAQAESDSHAKELETERMHLQSIPREEAAHMKQILESYGLTAATADAVNRDVAALPLERQIIFHAKFELGIDMDDRHYPIRNAITMWLSFVLGAFIPVLPWILTPVFRTAIAGSVGGGMMGMVGISVYQARGQYAFLCRIMVRQIIVTSLAVGLTVAFDMCFTESL